MRVSVDATPAALALFTSVLVSCLLPRISCKPHYHFSINGLDMNHQAGTTPNIYDIPFEMDSERNGNMSNGRPSSYPLGSMTNAEPGVGPGWNGPTAKGGLKCGGCKPGTDPGLGFGSGKDGKSE